MKGYNMQLLKWFQVGLLTGTLAVSSGSVGVLSQSVQAQESQVSITSAQSSGFRLLDAKASEQSVDTRNTMYYFTINLPKDAPRLERITILQVGGRNLIEYNKDRIGTFVNRQRGQQVPLKEIKIDPKSQEVTVVFARPLQPGQIVTVNIGPFENPQTDGNYLFSVKAFPQGDTNGQLVGYARLRFVR
ncbi:MAG: DUF2808 domain-containing protein [Chlorogloeopsis fritschii C42_A2020_084]|jgi:hypothetical protein|nr:DUF2808 domain-containing protein [Chlorogloeopsis fritschii C42_A2020_084]